MRVSDNKCHKPHGGYQPRARTTLDAQAYALFRRESLSKRAERPRVEIDVQVHGDASTRLPEGVQARELLARPTPPWPTPPWHCDSVAPDALATIHSVTLRLRQPSFFYHV